MITSSQTVTKTIVLCLFLWMLFPSYLIGQSLGVSGGLVSSHLYDLVKEAPQRNIEYQSGSGYFIQLALLDQPFGKSIWSTDFRFDLAIDLLHYLGQFRNGITSPGGGSSTVAELEKSVVQLSFFPITGRYFGEKLKLGMGLGLGAIIDQEISGYRIASTPIGSQSIDLSETEENYNAYIRFSLLAKVSYSIPVFKNTILRPQYQFNLGLSSEVDNIGNNTRNILHMFGLGFCLSL